MDTINEQTKLNTLELFSVQSVFDYITKNTNTMCFIIPKHCNYDIYSIMCAIYKYDIKVNGILINNGLQSESISKVINKYDNLKYLHINGNYNFDTNYNSVKYFGTNLYSLHLLRNFRNITRLDITIGSPSNVNNYDTNNLKKDLVLNNLKEIVIYYACNINLEDMLHISPNLNVLCVNKKGILTLTDIENIIHYKCTTKFVSLIDILKLSSSKFNHTDCISMLSTIVYRYMIIICKKHRSVKFADFCNFRNVTTSMINYTLMMEKTCFNMLSLAFINDRSLKANPTHGDLQNIILYAYKVVCLYVAIIKDYITPQIMLDIYNM